MLICGLAVLLFTLGDGPPPGSDLAWGWWLTLIGGLAIVTASVGTAVARVRGEPEQRWVSSSFSWRRTALGGLAIAGAVVFLLVFLQVLFVPERASWPPPVRCDHGGAGAGGDREVRGRLTAATRRRPRVRMEHGGDGRAVVGGQRVLPTHLRRHPRTPNRRSTSSCSAGTRTRSATNWRRSCTTSWPRASRSGSWSTTRDRILTVSPRRCTASWWRPAPSSSTNDTIQPDFDGPFIDRELDWRQDELGRAEHRKLYVIDGVVAWTGGAGVQDHFEDGRFHDVMVRVTGDVVRQAQAVFLTSFRAHGAPVPADLDEYFPAQPRSGDASDRPRAGGPWRATSRQPRRFAS